VNPPRVIAVTVGVIALLVLAGFYLAMERPWSGQTSTGVPLSELQVCQTLTTNQTALNTKALSRVNVSVYDEQLWLGFERNFTSMSYNVTAVAQNDTFGVGPAYLLNGFSTKGLWYQVGIGWTAFKGESNGSFGFAAEVWNTTARELLYSYPVPFSGVSANDSVRLSLNFSRGNVMMEAYDWKTKAEGDTSYPAYGATQFVSNGSRGFPTSLLTEWYHGLPYYCSNHHVVFSNRRSPLTSAWMHIDEWNFTGACRPQRLNFSEGKQCFAFSSPSETVHYSQPSTLVPFSANGTTIYSNSTSFITM
jgi:hypothetical protein